jgi:nicotinate-nucleotide adenylyltransferase
MPDGSPTETSPARRGLGVFGGSFNPPTLAHVALARTALERLPIQELLVIPAGDHPHKRNQDMAPATDRLAMCRLAFQELAGARVDDRELRRSGPSFTVDTLAELATSGQSLFLLIGSDNLPLLPTWREPLRLLAMCTVVTYPRVGYPITDAQLRALPLPAAERDRLRANVLPVPALAAASSDLRARWRAGERELPELPPAVRNYLEMHGLYR